MSLFFFFNDTATTEIYTLSLHDALPIYNSRMGLRTGLSVPARRLPERLDDLHGPWQGTVVLPVQDRKSTRLNSSHSQISYAVFCLKKKKKQSRLTATATQSHTESA